MNVRGCRCRVKMSRLHIARSISGLAESKIAEEEVDSTATIRSRHHESTHPQSTAVFYTLPGTQRGVAPAQELEIQASAKQTFGE